MASKNYIKNKRILKKIKDLKMKFGVEVEGAFSYNLYKKLRDKGLFKDDGSVLLPNVIARQWGVECELVDYTEWASDVMKYEELIDILEELDEKNGYFYDRQEWTSGLHLHLSLPNRQALFLLASDWEKFKELQRWIRREYEERINKSIYCRAYDKRSFISKGFYRGDKYRVMRFHPQGTLEFRFLYPDERKIDNVNKTIEFVVSKFFKRESETFTAFNNFDSEVKQSRQYNITI